MHVSRIDRRQCFALTAGLLLNLRGASAGEVEERSSARFVTGRVTTGGKELEGRFVLGSDELEVLDKKRRRSFALSKVRLLELPSRSASPSAAEGQGDRERELVELAARLVANPRDTTGIEAWLQLLRNGYTAPQPIGPPLAGDVWVVPDETRHHAEHAASAFALDLAVLGPRGRVLLDKGKKSNEDYASWGAPLLAVADGKVARARDDLTDDEPFKGVADPSRANDLVLSFEGGLAFYQHLRQGSLRVKPGDRVQRGDELARVGNSGNASWPHLHFAVYERFGTGTLSVPVQVEAYTLTGRKRGVGGKARAFSVACHNIPLQEGWVVHLPLG
jgi:murein DD-endopeptidase MepM/ murein hydrolase activator NlpD